MVSKNYKMLADEDIIGDDDDDSGDEDGVDAQQPADNATTKWKRLEEDLKRIRDKEAQRDEIQELRSNLEGGEGKGKDGELLSKRE